MCKKFKCSILVVLIISLVVGFVLAIGTRYGYRVYNVFFTKGLMEANRITTTGYDLPQPRTEQFYPTTAKCAGYSGVPFTAYSKCATNSFLDSDNTGNTLGMKCSTYKWGEWSIVLNWAFWSILIYIILRILSHKCKLKKNNK